MDEVQANFEKNWVMDDAKNIGRLVTSAIFPKIMEALIEIGRDIAIAYADGVITEDEKIQIMTTAVVNVSEVIGKPIEVSVAKRIVDGIFAILEVLMKK